MLICCIQTFLLSQVVLNIFPFKTFLNCVIFVSCVQITMCFMLALPVLDSAVIAMLACMI